MLKKDLTSAPQNNNALKHVVDFLNHIRWIPRKYGKWETHNGQIHFKSTGKLSAETESQLLSGATEAILKYCDDRYEDKNFASSYMQMFADSLFIKRNDDNSNNSSHFSHDTTTYTINLTPDFIAMVELFYLTNNLLGYGHAYVVNKTTELHSFHKQIVDLFIDDVIDDIHMHCLHGKELTQCTIEELKQAIKIADECINAKGYTANNSMIFTTTTSEATKQSLIKTIQHCKKVLTHPAPQNRASGDENALMQADIQTETGALPDTPEVKNGIYDGQVYFWVYDDNGNKELSDEPVGLFGLTAKNVSPQPTREMVHGYYLEQLGKYKVAMQSQLNKLIIDTIQNDIDSLLTQLKKTLDNKNYQSMLTAFCSLALKRLPAAALSLLLKQDELKGIIAQLLKKEISLENNYFLCAQTHDLDAIKLLVENGASIDEADQFHNTPFIIATHFGHINTVLFLLDQLSKQNESNDNRNTIINNMLYQLISVAIKRQNTNMIDSLLKKHPDFINTQQAAVIFTSACKLGTESIIEPFIAKAINSNQHIDIKWLWVDVTESKNNSLTVMKLLMKNNFTSAEAIRAAVSNTFKQLADKARYGYDSDEQKIQSAFNTIKYLAKYCSDFSHVSQDSIINALSYAIEQHDEQLINCIVKCTQHINFNTRLIRDNRNINYPHILNYAVIYNNWKAIELFIEKGADVNKIFMFAVLKNDLEMVQKILDKYKDKIDINTTYLHNNTALFYASENKNIDLCRLLLKHHINVNHINESGNSALIEVICNNMTQFIFEERKDICVTDMYSSMFSAGQRSAIDQCKLTLVKLLVESGANIDTRNQYGKTAIDYARMVGNQVVYDYLSTIAANKNSAVTAEKGMQPKS